MPCAFLLLLLLPSVPAAEAAAGTPTLPLRSPDGKLQVVALRAVAPVIVDGALDDDVWLRAAPVAGFVQSEPHEGEPASEPTEVRVAFDAQTLYIAAHCHDSEPRRLVVNNIRKDFAAGEQDSFEVVIDSFGDRRNGFLFMTNPEGARADQQLTNEGKEINASWDAVWTVRARRVADGWTAELAIPFRSLRFVSGEAGAWGINFSRRIRRKNEIAFWSPVPRAYSLSRVSLAGALGGLPALEAGRNLRIKPYVAARSVREAGGASFAQSGDLGVDLKYGLTSALTLDATGNPDFAQAEADEQQVNLTQFSLFFPEKRDFFLENSGVFYVGDAARNNRVNPTPTPDEDLLPFFSRRIGLTDSGREIPILAGARVTGRLAGLGIGALSVQTRASDEAPANNFSVLRLRRNVLGLSDVGAILLSRQSTDSGGDWNRVYGIDSNIRLFKRLDWSSYFLRSATPGLTAGQYAARSSLNWEGNFFHGKGGLLSIGEGFNDELGYYRRTGVRKWFMDVGVRPRFPSLQRRGVREMHPHLVWDYFEDQSGRIVAKFLHSGYTFFLNNGGFFELSANPRFERIRAPFTIHRGTPAIPPGSYGWNEWKLFASSDPSRPLSLSLTGFAGGLWSGTQRTLNSTLTLRPSFHFTLALGLQRTSARLDEPSARFVSSLVTARANYSFNTRLFLDALVQYDRDRRAFNTNVRLNLIHRPLSDLYVVFNEQRFATPDAPPAGRGVIVKFTRLVSF